MAPAYKLTYFDVTALGEAIRFLFSYGGIDFEDIRIQHEAWPALKSKTPFGQLPLLEHNGKTGYQSLAICRYVAKQVKLVGKDDWEDLEIDATVDTINDLRSKLLQYKFEKDEKVQKAMAESLFKETLPFYLERLDAQAKKNKGYFVGGRVSIKISVQLTWADVFFGAALDALNFITEKDITADFPNLKKVKENVLNIPKIKTWIEKRPKTAF